MNISALSSAGLSPSTLMATLERYDLVPEPGSTPLLGPIGPGQEHVALHKEGGFVLLENMRWGLVPGFRTQQVASTRLGEDEILRIPLDTVAHSQMLSDGLAAKRCAMPICSWTQDGTTYAASDRRGLWLAGIWDHCLTADGRSIDGFALIVGGTDEVVELPIALEETELRLWLSGRLSREHLRQAIRRQRFEPA